MELNYSRWQLLAHPLSLKTFNEIPRLTAMFFEYQLALSSDTPTPIEVTGSAETEIRMRALEVTKYKYKFYPADEVNALHKCTT